MDDDGRVIVQRAVDRAAGAVVRIGRGWGRGGGFLLADGQVVTNAHNLRGDRVTVSFADGRAESASVLGVDVDGDLAVLAVPTGGGEPLTWADGPTALGQAVVTVTHDAAAGPRATLGRVSALGAAFRSPRGRLVRDAVEHTAPLARGSSGAPLLDDDGRLLGVNTHRRGDGFYLAIPATAELRRRLDALAAGADAPTGVRLGVAVAPPEVARRLREAVGLPDRAGLLVRGVEEGGAADRAGIRRGDLLVAAGDDELTTSDALFAILDRLSPPAELVLTVVRGSEELQVRVELPASPPHDEPR